jgi:Fe-S oxidoreductase
MNFVEALDERINEVVTACTQCGKCFEICPMIETIGLKDANSQAILHGTIDFLKGLDGGEEAQRWITACSSCGDCRSVCDYGVDPLFLVRMANYVNARRRNGPDVKKNALASFRGMAKAVRIVSRLQLNQKTLERIQPIQPQTPVARSGPPPEIAFYTGCNIAKTPHILLLCLEVMEALGVSYEVLGGTSSCCGINQFRAGDGDTAGRAGLAALKQIDDKKAAVNVAWCPSCLSQFDEIIIPNHQRITGRTDFDLVPFLVFLETRLEDLRRLFKHPVHKRVALNERPGYPAVVTAVEKILQAIPGVELVHVDVPRVGLMANYLTRTPKFKEKLRLTEFAAVAEAKATTLATIFHACHRELCHFENEVSFEIINVMEIIGESMGLHADDIYKQLKMAENADAMMVQCAPLIAQHGLNAEEAIEVLIAEQLAVRPTQKPLPEI